MVNVAISAALALTGYLATTTLAGFPDTPSVVQYWGQNSGGGQQPLATYCDDSTDALLMSFVNNFNIGSLPDLNLASSCKGSNFPNTNLLDCPQVSSDIKTCQAHGKKILLSLGGATGSYGFQSDSQGEQFAETLWNLFGGGTSDTRPFGDAVVDGFDLDIESGGPTGYVAFVNALRKHFASDAGKTYYITGAPQCPFPDASLGETLNKASFDAVNVQFYNNFCAIDKAFNFDDWDKWAKSGSANPDIKILVGVPGSPSAAGSGYVSIETLSKALNQISQSSSYGGVSVWDASQSYSNTEASPNFAVALGQLVHNGASSAGESNSTVSGSASGSHGSNGSSTGTVSHTSAVSSSEPNTTAVTSGSTASGSAAVNVPADTDSAQPTDVGSGGVDIGDDSNGGNIDEGAANYMAAFTAYNVHNTHDRHRYGH